MSRFVRDAYWTNRCQITEGRVTTVTCTLWCSWNWVRRTQREGVACCILYLLYCCISSSDVSCCIVLYRCRSSKTVIGSCIVRYSARANVPQLHNSLITVSVSPNAQVSFVF